MFCYALKASEPSHMLQIMLNISDFCYFCGLVTGKNVFLHWLHSSVFPCSQSEIYRVVACFTLAKVLTHLEWNLCEMCHSLHLVVGAQPLGTGSHLSTLTRSLHSCIIQITGFLATRVCCFFPSTSHRTILALEKLLLLHPAFR